MKRSTSEPLRPVHEGRIEKALITNRALIALWRVLLSGAGIVGLVLNSRGPSGFFPQLVFFTIQSNVLLLICMLFALLAVVRGVAGPAPFVKSAVTFYISITGLVYNFLLTRMVSPEQLQIISPLSNMLLHTVTPVMAVIDWLLFDVHGRLRWRDALLWLLYPAAYFVFALVRGALIGAGWLGGYFKYPYPFLNVDTLGNGGVARNFMIYGVGFWLLGLLFVALDRLIKRLQRVQVS